MLNLLSKSKIRRKIILLFVYNQEKEFYLSEIARQVKTSAGTAQRELNRLRRMDFVSFKKRGNLSLYRLNRAFSVLGEIEAIIRKTLGIEVLLGEELRKVKGTSFAFIFGSYAAGRLRSGSDIDLYVVGKPDEDDVYRAVRSVEDTVGREINYHIANEDEFTRKARTDSFTRDVLAKLVMVLGEEDGLRKLAG
jgi:predicted nucleotidyltransferase/predicted transcriptional regulator with HTH domain